MKITELKRMIREIIKEETEYQKFFKKELEKTGKSIPQMSDDEKKDFFNKIDAAWKGKGEKNENINEYDEWRNTRIQAKHIFRMLRQKYNNNISDMKKGLEDIIKQNKTKDDQADVLRDEFNKFFKISEATLNDVGKRADNTVKEQSQWSSEEQKMVNQIMRMKRGERKVYELPMKTQQFYRKHKDKFESVNNESVNEAIGSLAILGTGVLAVFALLQMFIAYKRNYYPALTLKGADSIYSNLLKFWKPIDFVNTWKIVKRDTKILKIVNRLKDDPEVKKFIENPKQTGWYKMLSKKLDASEMDMLNKIYKRHFDKDGPNMDGSKWSHLESKYIKHVKSNESVVNEVASRTAMEIGGLTGMNKDAIQKFVDDNNLDIEKVYQYVKKSKFPQRMDFVTAIAGKPNNPIQKKMIKIFSESVVNEDIDDLVGDTYSFEIGSGTGKLIKPNPREYVIEKLSEALQHYLFDSEFYYNYLDSSDQKIYINLFQGEVLKPFLHKNNINRTLKKYFTVDSNRKLVSWKLSRKDSEKFRDDFFRKNKKIPSNIKREYYDYRLDYAGVKLKESTNESNLKGYLVADVVDDIIKSIGSRFVSGEIKNTKRDGKTYIKLKDEKFGSGVVKILKSRFGIDAKLDYYDGKGKLASSPSVSFFSDTIIDEKMDLNDPLLIRLRAAQLKRNQQAADRLKKAKSDKEKEKVEKLAKRNATKIKALKKKRAEVMRDMEQEAEPEGGKIANRYGDLLNKIDNDIIKLGGNPIGESVNEDTKKRFDVDFYKDNGDRQTSHEEIIRGNKFSDIVSQATKVAKSKGMDYVEFYYKDLFIGSIDKRNGYQFKKGRNSQKSPLSVNEEFKKGDTVKWAGDKTVKYKIEKDAGKSNKTGIKQWKIVQIDNPKRGAIAGEPDLKKESVNEGIGTIALGVAGGLLLLKVLKFIVKKTLGAIGMNAKLPKEKLLEIVDAVTSASILKHSGDINPIQIIALKRFLTNEIEAGNITNVKQIVQTLEKASK
jgi:hypothetical protein